MANLNITNIPAPRVSLIDERTGLMSREWYRFFLNLFVLTGSGNNPISLEELQLGPPNQPELAELLLQINQNIAPQYEDQSGDFLATLDTAQLMSMMARFENAEAAIQGAYLQPVVQTGTIANYNLDGSPTAGGIAYGTGPALAVSAAGTLGQVLTSGGAGAPTWAAASGGSVTSVSVVSANGLAGTVATATTTPAITLSTTVTGLLKGNGTAISAATSGTDYAPATSGTSILYGNGAGGFSNVTIGTGVAFSGGTLSATGSGGTVTSVAALTLGTTGTDLSSTVATGTTTPVITLQVPTASAANRGALSAADWTTFNNKGSGTVTSVTGTAPVVSSGGTTPAISMAAATTSVNGYLTSTDWTTFNNKQAALVSGTNIKTVNGTTLLGSGDLGTITYAYGGTGLTSYTAGDIIYASAANTVAKLAIGTSGQRLVVAAGLPSWATDTTTGTVTSVAASVPTFLSVAGSPITTSGTLAITLSGTALPVLNGGTGVTTSTGTGNTVLSAAPTLSGDVTLSTGNLVIGTSGKGIDFSATSGTGTSELLADYEEGTWTATDLSGAGLSFTANRQATYTKVGRQIFAYFDISYPITVSGVSAVISLPFQNSTVHDAAVSFGYVTYATPITGDVARSQSYFYPCTFNGSNVTNASLSTQRLIGVAVYEAS